MWIALDYITVNKDGIAADSTLNMLHIDMFLKELQFYGTSYNQIYFNQLQYIFKKQNTLGYKYMKRPFQPYSVHTNFKFLLICKPKSCTVVKQWHHAHIHTKKEHHTHTFQPVLPQTSLTENQGGISHCIKSVLNV